MNTQEYAEISRLAASWAQSIRNGQAVLVADALERVSAYCLEQAAVPDEYIRESFKCPYVNDVEQKKSGLICPAPTWKWLQGLWSKGKRKTTA